jgi:hypothetical protein
MLEYSFALTQSSAPGHLLCRLAWEPFRRRGRRRCGGDWEIGFRAGRRLSASPKLGNEQTPIELLTPDADEAVSAKKRTR